MKLLLKLLAVVLFTCFQAQIGFGQEEYYEPEEENTYVEESEYVRMANITIGQFLPQKAFKRKLDKNPIQFNFSFYHQLDKNKPLFLGMGFTFSPIYSYSQDVDINTDNGLEVWDSDTYANFKVFDLYGRYYLPIGIGKLGVFGEINFGVNWFSTRTTLLPPGAEESQGQYDNNSTNLKYGVDLGLHYAIGKNGYIQAKIGYHPGLSANYDVKRKDLNQPLETTLDAFNLQKSATDVIKWDLGYTFAF